MNHCKTGILIILLSIALQTSSQDKSESNELIELTKIEVDSINIPSVDNPNKYERLTDEDYKEVADYLGIEIAAIKAVSDIEAGKSHKGFASPGVPIINFDLSIFNKLLRRAKFNPAKYRKKYPIAFSRVNVRKYGTYSKAQFVRLENARKINENIANESTFWGMFQIGGFNWRKCGVSSINEFIEKMSESEYMQLYLFAEFIKNSDMVKYLKNKNWRSFSIAYNGPSAISKGYNKRIAKAYAKYSKQ